MRLRVRGPNGVTSITLDDTATWHDLKAKISEATSVPDFDVKYGYPPQPLNTESIDDAAKVSDLGVKLDGEQLIILPRNLQATLSSPMHSAPPPQTVKTLPGQTNPPRHNAGDFPDQQLNLTRKKNPTMESEPPEIPVPSLDGVLLLRVMPDDNSCLFRALSSAVLGSSLDGMTELRSIVAQQIQANPEMYSAAVLEKEPSDYCRWIQREDSWGGGIELSILSQHFDIEIVSINVQDVRLDRFNEGKATRCILVYSGIHYDVCAIAPFPGADPEFDRKVFSVVRTGDEEMDGGAVEAARELCKELQKRHYYTDTAGFGLKCNQCGSNGNGEKWAVKHAADTGHADFGEA